MPQQAPSGNARWLDDQVMRPDSVVSDAERERRQDIRRAIRQLHRGNAKPMIRLGLLPEDYVPPRQVVDRRRAQ